MANSLTYKPNDNILERLMLGSTLSGDCLIWRNKDKNGYGCIGVRPEGSKKYITRLVHRVAYVAHHGKIPSDLVIDHTCGIRNCISPKHLEAVTQKENVHRAVRSITTINSRKTHCVNGHTFSLENTYSRQDRNSRECKTCRKEAVRKYTANLKVRV